MRSVVLLDQSRFCRHLICGLGSLDTINYEQILELYNQKLDHLLDAIEGKDKGRSRGRDETKCNSDDLPFDIYAVYDCPPEQNWRNRSTPYYQNYVPDASVEADIDADGTNENKNKNKNDIVYRLQRDSESRFTKNLRVQSANATDIITVLTELLSRSRTRAVSYTHLDVYKRQG